MDQTLARRNIAFLVAVSSSLEFGEGGYHSSDFLEAVSDWLVLDIRITNQTPLEPISRNIVERVETQAFRSYTEAAADQLHLEGSKTKGFTMSMAAWVEKEAKKLSKKFPEPITECVVSISDVPLH